MALGRRTFQGEGTTRAKTLRRNGSEKGGEDQIGPRYRRKGSSLPLGRAPRSAWVRAFQKRCATRAHCLLIRLALLGPRRWRVQAVLSTEALLPSTVNSFSRALLLGGKV